MDLKHKHWALIFLGILVTILAGIIAWNIFGSSHVVISTPSAATTTPQTATNTVAAPESHITEHTTYYDINLAYPSATPLASLSAEANANAVTAMRAAMQSTAEQFKKDGNFANLTHDDVQKMGLDQRKESLSAEYKTYTGSHTVSYVFVIYEDTFGAHPNTFYKAFTFETGTGAQLSVTDYLDFYSLSLKARQKLPSIIAKREQIDIANVDKDSIANGTLAKEENFQNWYVKGNYLVIIFPPYQVGPYALGTVELPISLGEIINY